MARTAATVLMFDGVAEEAMFFYCSIFRGAEIEDVSRYGPQDGPLEGKVRQARFRVGGHNLICFDSPVEHDFGFTPSTSLFVDCSSPAELEAAFSQLLQDGVELMPLGEYGGGTRFGWLTDRFGVSWQLSLAAAPAEPAEGQGETCGHDHAS